MIGIRGKTPGTITAPDFRKALNLGALSFLWALASDETPNRRGGHWVLAGLGRAPLILCIGSCSGAGAYNVRPLSKLA